MQKLFAFEIGLPPVLEAGSSRMYLQRNTIGRSPFLSEFFSAPYRSVPYRTATDRLSF
jgi:hypothetical protein